MLVADSNLFRSHPGGSGVSVVDAATPCDPALLGFIPAGRLPTPISVPSRGAVALVTTSDSRQLWAISLRGQL